MGRVTHHVPFNFKCYGKKTSFIALTYTYFMDNNVQAELHMS